MRFQTISEVFFQVLFVAFATIASGTSQPLGVVAGITPFNFPAMVPMWMWPVAVWVWLLSVVARFLLSAAS